MAGPSGSGMSAGPSHPSRPPSVDPDADLRRRLKEETYRFTGRTPFDWQLEMAAALCRGQDVLCLSPTGSGKTLPFVMPCFADPKTLVWIVSPLNYIEQQQARVFSEEWHLPAIAVNATTSYAGLHKDILNGKYQVIITSPEQLLEYNKLRPILIQLSGEGYNHIVVVDECHCICIWSEQFRKMYGLLGSLRTFLMPNTPFCAATATATKSMQKQILSSLRYKDDYLPINRGWWKANISWHAYYMQGSDSSIGDVTRMFPKNLESAEDITPSIIFVDKRALAFRMMGVLRDFLPPELGDQVEVYHALQSQIAKDRTARRFEKGKIKILVCTEALTMGCDFRKVVQIILFKVPESLPTVLQRGGRAGRDETIKARVVLMVEGSKRALAIAKLSPGLTSAEPVKVEDEVGDLLMEIVDLEGMDAGGDGEAGEEDEAAQEAIRVAAAEHGKEDHEFLQRFYAPTDECRTLVLDEAFDSPPHAPCISVNGCDNCIRRRIKELEAAKEGTHLGDGLVKQEPVEDLNALDRMIEDLRALLIEPNEAKQKKPSTRGKYRRMDERDQLEASLKSWRGEIFESTLKKLGIHTDYIVTDQAIKAIARILPPVTLQSLSLISPAWPEKARTRWGPSLLAKIDEYDLPNRIVERQVKRAQVKAEKTKAKKEEGGMTEPQGMSGARNRKRPASGSALKSTPMKKVRVEPADSALSAEGSSQSTRSKPLTATSKAPAHVSMGRPAATSSVCITSATPDSSSRASASKIAPLPSIQSQPADVVAPAVAVAPISNVLPSHYRPDTHISTLVAQINDFSTARPVGTMFIQPQIQKNTNRPSTFDSSNPEASSCNMASLVATPAVKNPKANRSYYKGEHLWR